MAEALQEAPGSLDPRLQALRRVAIVPGYNEEGSIGAVIDEIRAVDPEIEIVVVDDGSRDRTAEAAASRGARVLQLPFNLGIGGAVQTGYPPAVLFAVATLFIQLVLLDYSTVISKLADQNTILAQRLALLEARIGEVLSRER